MHLGLIGSFTVDQHEWTAEVPAVGAVRLRLRTDQHVADLRGPNLCQVATPEQVDAVLARLGPDPLRPDADPDVAWARITKSSRTVAELLMDQSVLAGVGNVYRSEVLFRHRLSPNTPGKNLRRASWRLIWDDLERLMPLGVATGRIVTVEEQVLEVEAALGRGEVPRLTERSSYVYKRGGMPCVVCGSKVRTQPGRRPQPVLVRPLPAPPLTRTPAPATRHAALRPHPQRVSPRPHGPRTGWGHGHRRGRRLPRAGPRLRDDRPGAAPRRRLRPDGLRGRRCPAQPRAARPRCAGARSAHRW